jgi:phosphatidylinositol glycan class B
MRPTSVLIWAPLVLWHLYRIYCSINNANIYRRCRCCIVFILTYLIPVVLPTLLFCTLVDRFGYGRWTFSWLNFAHFNVFSGGSAHFGVHAWYWYICGGLQAVLGSHTICLCFALRKGIEFRLRPLAYISLFYILFHSFVISHKEHRFLLPILPLLSIIIAQWLCSVYSKCDVGIAKKTDSIKPVEILRLTNFWRTLVSPIRYWLIFLLMTNLPIALYTCLLHQRAPIDVMQFISNEAYRVKQSPDDRLHALFLMPCHSTPFYSHVHLNVSMRFLQCTPNFENVSNYFDEADTFYSNPHKFITENVSTVSLPPRLLIMFESMWILLGRELTSLGYIECRKYFHSHFPISERQSQYLIVACLKNV